MCPIETDERARDAKGGTELIAERLARSLPPDLLDRFQIVLSRSRPPDPSRIRILWCHDLPLDADAAFLGNGGWRRFHRIVFVSNWQMQGFIARYEIPWSHCHVMPNAIEPIAAHVKPAHEIRLGYWSRPGRALEILVPVFDDLSRKYDDIALDIFSGFDLYGWPERNQPFERLFADCRAHPRIAYHGTVPNPVLREALKSVHILAYASNWESSCMVLMEAMSAGILAVHSNYAAMYETAANFTSMYQFQDNLADHAALFHHVLDHAIASYRTAATTERLAAQKAYCDRFYNWERRALEWRVFLEGIRHFPLMP